VLLLFDLLFTKNVAGAIDWHHCYRMADIYHL